MKFRKDKRNIQQSFKTDKEIKEAVKEYNPSNSIYSMNGKKEKKYENK